MTWIGTYLENVVECLPICKMSGGDSVEVFQTAPPRKFCHSTKDVKSRTGKEILTTSA